MSRNKIYDQLIDELKAYFENDCNFESFYLLNPLAKHNAILLLQNMHDVYVAKDTDYSENDLPMGNLRESTELGIEPWKGVLLRIGDKKRRIGSFIKKNDFQVKDEAVEDTLIDMANYSLLGASLFHEVYPDSELKTTWSLMARFCILTKICFDQDKKFWSVGLWPYVLAQYNKLATFACK
jgi:hypothetical protein